MRKAQHTGSGRDFLDTVRQAWLSTITDNLNFINIKAFHTSGQYSEREKTTARIVWERILVNRPSDRGIESRISKIFQALSNTAQFKIESSMGIDISLLDTYKGLAKPTEMSDLTNY